MTAHQSRGLTSLIVWWVDQARRRAIWVVLTAFACSALSIQYTANNLGINTDTAEMIAPELPWRQDYIAYKNAFPGESDNLFIVVDGDTPELAARASRTLAETLVEQKELVESVRTPGAGEFFERHALLYLDLDELRELSDRLIRIQPFLGTLARDPSLVGFAALLRQLIDARARGEDIDLLPFLQALSRAAEASAAGRFHETSWQTLMLGRPPRPNERRRVIMVKPRLDWSLLFPAGAVIERIRDLAHARELGPEHGVRVRITGSLAMEHEELETVLQGAEFAGLLALVMVSIVLVAGLRSMRLVAASLITLLVGLTWTAAFATAAVGHLNLISVAFAVLYIGLGIDYAVHYCLRYRELVNHGLTHDAALSKSAGDVGGSLLVCAITTGIGFYAFVPTDFLGVSELGLISGTGMFISLLATLSVLPALLTLTPLAQAARPLPALRGLRRELSDWPYRHHRGILVGSALLAITACGAVPRVWFDANPLNLRNPKTESVSTFLELLSDVDATPWRVIELADDASEAARLANEFDVLEPVVETRTLESFVPDDQVAKLALLEELELMLGLNPVEQPVPPSRTRAECLRALIELRTALDELDGIASVEVEAERLGRALDALVASETSSSATSRGFLERFERGVLGGLTEQLRSLGLFLSAESVQLADLPPAFVKDWIGADGRRRVEVNARANLYDRQALGVFLDAVREVSPRVTGTPVVYVESGKSVVRAFQEAFALALVLITITLFLLLRRVRHVAQVLLPIVLAFALTMAVMVVIGVPFNFANVIALPLLMGVGVDNGIHIVQRSRAAPTNASNVLHTSTTRAVIVSALTTICSFGSLAFSPHPGTASMGLVLSIGLFMTLLTSLLLLPAMLAGEHRDECINPI